MAVCQSHAKLCLPNSAMQQAQFHNFLHHLLTLRSSDNVLAGFKTDRLLLPVQMCMLFHCLVPAQLHCVTSTQSNDHFFQFFHRSMSQSKNCDIQQFPRQSDVTLRSSDNLFAGFKTERLPLAVQMHMLFHCLVPARLHCTRSTQSKDHFFHFFYRSMSP